MSDRPIPGLDDDPNTIRFDPWAKDIGFRGGGEHFAELVTAVASLMDVVAGSAPSASSAQVAGRLVDRAREALMGEYVGPGQGFSGFRYDLPGRGHALLAPVKYLRWVTHEIVGDVVFGTRHVGGNGAVHGGVLPLLFDEIFGRLSNTNRVDRCRIAYLRVDYRQVTLPEVCYAVRATVDREVGRKRFLSGALTTAQGEVVAEATGLFVVLRDGAS